MTAYYTLERELAEARHQLCDALEAKESLFGELKRVVSELAEARRQLADVPQLKKERDYVGRENAYLAQKLAEAQPAMLDALSDFEWAERAVPGTNFQASILKLRYALGIPEASSAEAQDVTSTALKEEIKELEATAESESRWANEYFHRFELWERRALYAGNAVRLLLAYFMAYRANVSRDCAPSLAQWEAAYLAWKALPVWMREMIVR